MDSNPSDSFNSSVQSFVEGSLIPFISAELSIASPRLLSSKKIVLEVTKRPRFECQITSGEERDDCFVVKISIGLLIRLTILCEVLIEATEFISKGRVFHGSTMNAGDFAFRANNEDGLDFVLSCCKDLRPLFADDYNENEHWTLINGLVDVKNLRSFGEDSSLGSLILPKRLSEVSKALTYRTVRFLIYHEIAHAALGHVAFFHKNPDLAGYDRKALELDADIKAVISILVRCLEDATAGPKREVRFVETFIGISVALLFMDVTMRSATGYRESTHLIPDFRYVLAVDFAEKNFISSMRALVTAAEFRSAWQSAICWCKNATDQLGITGGAFFTIDRELFINWSDNLLGFEIKRIEEPILSFTPEEKAVAFKMLPWVDSELAQTLIIYHKISDN